jgi:hypothetical protein
MVHPSEVALYQPPQPGQDPLYEQAARDNPDPRWYFQPPYILYGVLIPMLQYGSCIGGRIW